MQSLTLFIEKRTIALCSDHLPLAIKKKPFRLLSSYIARGRLFLRFAPVGSNVRVHWTHLGLRSAPVGSRACVHWTHLASRHRTRGVVEFDTSGLFM